MGEVRQRGSAKIIVPTACVSELTSSNTHLHHVFGRKPSLISRCPREAFLGQNQVWNQKHFEQDKDAEATGEPVPETSLPTTSTASITTTMTRGQPPAISLIRAAIDGDVAALAQHRQAQLLRLLSQQASGDMIGIGLAVRGAGNPLLICGIL